MRDDHRTEVSGLPAKLTTAHGEFGAQVYNLSTRGLMASAQCPLAVGDQVDIKIEPLPWTRGQVRWVKGGRFGLLLLTALPIDAVRMAGEQRMRRQRPPRFHVRIPVHIEATGISRSATIQNISISGVALETGLPVAPGRTLTIQIEGCEAVAGRVRWSRGSRCGVMLDQPLEQDVLDRLALMK